MRKLLLILLLAGIVPLAYSQLSGTKTIPGDYTTIQAAIAALNSQGVGSGGVTFNVTAGHTETFTATNAGLITATGTAADPIVFQKSGGGANPLVTAASGGTGTMDYIFCLSGSDYVTFNGIDVQENGANTTSTLQMEWAYAILKNSGTDGAQNNTIKNCNISLNAANTASYAIYSNNITPSSTTQLTVTDIAGTNSNNKFFGLNITNTYHGFYLYGRADASPYTYYDQNNEVGVTTPNIVTGLGNTSGTSASYGMYCYYQNGVKLANTTFTGTSPMASGSQYLFYLSTSTNSNVDVYGNTVSMTYNGTGSFYAIYASGFGSSGTTNTVNFYNNSIVGNNLPNHTSGTVYLMYVSTGGVNANCYGNNISNNTIGSGTATSTGSLYYLYFASSPTTAGTTYLYNNTITNNARIQSTVGSASTYILYNGGSGNFFYEYNNTVNNITIGSSSTTYCLYNLFSGVTKYVHHNTISNIYNANSTVYGIYNGNGTGSGYFYDNKVQNINMASTSGTIYGIYQSSGINQYHYNTYISELYAPVATGNPAIYGIYLSGATTIGAINNTIYLNAASTGASFGVTGLYASTTPTVTLRNNIVLNNSTPGATGRVVAYQRSSTTLTSYAMESNNNDFYAGTPGTTRLIYYDGTNSDQTLADFKSRVSPRDGSSITEVPPFVNIAANPYDLHIQTSTATQCESGGATVSTPVDVTDDYDGNPRYPNPGYPDNVSSPATAPDIGADEFGGIMLDLSPPNILFTPFMNTHLTTSRTLVTTITDNTGVPTAGSGLPVLYWKVNSGSYSSAQATYLGSNQYSFTFGGGVVLNDVVSYYIVAQDVVSPTPNIVASPSAGAAGYTFSPPACSTPPTTPYSYTIVGTLSGTYAVGAGQTYPTITAAIADLNLKEVVGPVNFELWDASYSASESFPLIIYSYAGMDASRPVTFKPKAGVTATVSGAPSTGILVLYGCDYVIIDGSNSGGTDRNLTFQNTSTSTNSYVIGVFHNGLKGAQNCTVKNCVVKAGINTSNSWAIILNALGGDFDNTTIQNNQLLNAYIGMQFVGLSTGITNNGVVMDNVFGSPNDAETLGNVALNVSNVDGLLIKNNTIQNLKTSTNPKGINLGTNAMNVTIDGNTITGIIYTGTGGYGGKAIDINTGTQASNMNIVNNAISNILGDGWSAFSSDAIVGIRILGATGGINIYHNSINLTGNISRSSTADVSAGIYVVSTSTNLDIRDNIIVNSLFNTIGVATAYSIYSDAASTAFTDINFNDYFVSGSQGVLAYLGGQRATLAAWQAATGKDANSVNADPLFTTSTDLHFTNAGLDNLGFYLASVPMDLSGAMRTSPPDMGAYEYGINPSVTTSDATNTTCESAVLHGSINANGLTVNTYFDYGLTTSYGFSVAGSPGTVTGSSPTAITANVSGLNPSATYHFRARGVTTGGVTAFGTDFTVVTNADGVPTAVTENATNIGTTTATMNGTVNANCNVTTVTFEYGTTIGYGTTVNAAQSPVSGGVLTAVNYDLGSLVIGQTYHYRVVGNSSAGTTYGDDMTFTTGAVPPSVVTSAASNIGNFTASLNGTVNANNLSSSTSFEWGLTTSYGNTVAGVPPTVTGNTNTPITAAISNLSYNTTYHYRAVGVNTAGTTYGNDMTFTTLCPIPANPGTITGPDEVCQATSGHVYTIAAVPYATGYVWTLPAGGTITGGDNTTSITVSYSSSATSGNVTVYASNECGGGTTASLAVTVNALPVPTITGADPACVGSNYVYSTESGMTGYTWTVSAGGQVTAGAGTNAITIHWNNTGAQSISVTYTSASGCPAASPTVMNLTVSALPVPTIVGSNIVCPGNELQVYTTESGYSGYTWTVSQGGTIVSGQGTYQIEVSWTNSGNKTVTVNYANASGCFAANATSFAVSVLALPAPAGPVTGPDEICEGEQATYHVNNIPNADDYIWTVPAGATIIEGAGTNNIKVLFGQGSSGNITVYGSNNCGNGPVSPARHVTVNPIPPTPVVTIDASYLLTSSSSVGNQWYLNGTMIAGATDQTYQAEEEGFYWTIVTVNGCSSEESNHVEVIFVGLDELPGTSVIIYPIPNEGKFTLSIVSPGLESYTVSIMNHLGVKVYEDHELTLNGKSQKVIDLGNISAGVYTLKIQDSKVNITRKILITR